MTIPMLVTLAMVPTILHLAFVNAAGPNRLLLIHQTTAHLSQYSSLAS